VELSGDVGDGLFLAVAAGDEVAGAWWEGVEAVVEGEGVVVPEVGVVVLFGVGLLDEGCEFGIGGGLFALLFAPAFEGDEAGCGAAPSGDVGYDLAVAGGALEADPDFLEDVFGEGGVAHEAADVGLDEGTRSEEGADLGVQGIVVWRRVCGWHHGGHRKVMRDGERLQ
jgi:hypothetical protein